jgi:exodeoxyribonuclease VII large subunit
VLSVFNRRFPSIRITILPVPVQGNEAAPAIIKALATAEKKQGPLSEIDAVLLTRGGGSLEDLWAFNDEALARKIAECKLPVVSAVGHEVDFTIADFVADHRAATPSAAAELLSPSQDEYTALFAAYSQQFLSQINQKMHSVQHTLDNMLRRLRHPGRRLEEQGQKLDEFEKRLQKGLTNTLFRNRSRLNQLLSGLRLQSPAYKLQHYKNNHLNLERQLNSLMSKLLERSRNRFEQQVHALNTVSPLATLSRGYAIALDSNEKVITSADSVKVGDKITTRLHKGSIQSKVEAISKEKT